MMKVQALTFLAPVRQDVYKKDITHIQELEYKLNVINNNLSDNIYVSFNIEKLPSVHFGRILLVTHGNLALYPAQLLISTNYNGSLEKHIEELQSSGGLDEILFHCEGYSDSKSTFKYFKKHSRYKSHFFAGTWGKTASEVIQEDRNRKIIEELMDSEGMEDMIHDLSIERKNSMSIFESIKEKVINQSEFVPVVMKGRLPSISTPIFGLIIFLGILTFGLSLIMSISSVLRLFGLLGLIFLSWIIIMVIYLRWKEEEDDEYPNKMAPSRSTGILVSEEDTGGQNQFSSVVEIKEGWFRVILLRIVLRVISFSAHYIFNKGKLGTIPTIHFARWVIIDKGRRLLFLSNFDGSWENYLGDFVDKAAVGLTAIWSNTKQFPKTKYLIRGGAIDEERFKAVARLNQIKTHVWYSAYSHLSVVNKNNNALIGKSLNEHLGPKRLRKILNDTLQIKPIPKIRKKNIQGLLIDSYGRMPEARYIFIKINDVRKFKNWLSKTKFTSAEYRPDQRAINIAFSKSGLEKFGLKVEDEAQFSRPFVEGMNTVHRNRILGDIEVNSPNNWKWGSNDSDKLHALIMLYAKSEKIMDQMVNEITEEGVESGFNIDIKVISGHYLKNGKEHFGFKDGVSQPAMKGISTRNFFNDVVEPGEFILGYKNEYDEMPNSPEPIVNNDKWKDWGIDGSYMVFRQLQQNVDVFWNNVMDLSKSSQTDIVPAINLASKIVGRKINGDPLATINPEDPRKPTNSKNEFNYKDDDPKGTKCPFGAHIRRANPRDSLSISPKSKDKEYAINIVKKHRILRKGRVYGPPVAQSMKVNDIIANMQDSKYQERGLNFICFNTNIERQFEFIQQTWINNPKFHDLYDEVDPLIGIQNTTESNCPFTVPTAPLRKRYNNLQQYVNVVGGAYFFFPSIKAIKQLSE